VDRIRIGGFDVGGPAQRAAEILDDIGVGVRLFGPLSVEIDGACLGPQDFGGVKPKQVLEVLLVRRGRAVHKEEIAELVWGELLPRNVEATLET